MFALGSMQTSKDRNLLDELDGDPANGSDFHCYYGLDRAEEACGILYDTLGVYRKHYRSSLMMFDTASIVGRYIHDDLSLDDDDRQYITRCT